MSAETASAPRTGYRLGAWLGIAALYAMVFFLGWDGYICGYIFWPDPAREVWVPYRLAHGDVLYRDLHFLFGPLAPYLNALWIRLLPLLPLDALHVAGAFNVLLCAFLLDRVAWNFVSRSVRLCIQLIFLFGIVVPGVLAPLGSLWTPYSFSYAYGITIGVASVWAGLRVLASPSGTNFSLLGALSTLALLSKVDAYAVPLAAAAVVLWRIQSLRGLFWVAGSAGFFLVLSFGVLFSIGVPWKGLLEGILPMGHLRDILLRQPGIVFLDPDGIRGVAYLGFALSTLILWARPRKLPLWAKVAIVAGWLGLACMERWYLFLRTMQAHAAVATWAYAAWAWSHPARDVRDRLLSAAAVACWGRLVVEYSAAPLLWSAQAPSPLLVLAAVRFWITGSEQILFRRHFSSGLFPRRACFVLAALAALGAFRMYRMVWREPSLVWHSPIGRMRVDTTPAGRLWWEVAERCDRIRKDGGTILEIPNDDLTLAIGQVPPHAFEYLSVQVAGKESEVVSRLRADRSITHVLLEYVESTHAWFGTEFGSRVADYLENEWEMDWTMGNAQIPFWRLTRERQREAGDGVTVYCLRRRSPSEVLGQ